MGKKVMIMNGSPRKNGNTELLAESFLKGFEQAGGQGVQFNLREMKINPCIGCYQCVVKKGSPCIQKDDMQKIYDALAPSDVIVYASPLYWWHFTAQMKACIDRLFAAAASRDMKLPKKDCFLIIAAEDDREENFQHIIPYYETCLTKNLGWENRGMLLAGGVNLVGDVEKTDYLQQAEQMGLDTGR